MRYSVQPRKQIFGKGYGFLSFARNMSKNIGKNISKNLIGICGSGMLNMRQNIFDHAKNLQQIHLKLLQKESFKKHQKQLLI